VVANDGSFRCANGCDGEGGDGSPSTVAWSFTRTFTTPGTIGYYCEQHQSSAMSGTLIVKAAAATASSLENPQPGSFQSGIGLLSGWSCQGPTVSIAIDGQAPLGTPYGGARADTASICGASNTGTGFGLLFNFNTLSAGSHSAQLFINGQPQGASTQFTVTVPGGEFLTGLSKQVSVPDFPTAGRTTVLTWQQSQQNFAIQSVAP
jgi:hypothetical protein